VVWTLEQAGWLAETDARVHVEIETGMGRQGVRPGAALDALLNAMVVAGLVLDGVCTHFCAAEIAEFGTDARAAATVCRGCRTGAGERLAAGVGACREFFLRWTIR